jgi:hypothetical protein
VRYKAKLVVDPYRVVATTPKNVLIDKPKEPFLLTISVFVMKKWKTLLGLNLERK